MTTGNPDFLKELDLSTWVEDHIFSKKKIDSIKTMSNKRHRYDLEIDDDTHWTLVKIGAEHKMHYEQYAEEVLKAHVEQYKLDQETKD